MNTWSKGPLLIVALAVSAAVSRGSVVTVDFEAIPAMSLWDGTPVDAASKLSDQYLAATGVRFGSVSPYVAVVLLGTGHAVSGTHGFGGVSATGVLDYGAPVTFTFFVPFDQATPAVTDFVSLRGDQSGGGGVGTLHAFDTAGNEIGIAVADDTGGQTWAISAPGIHSVRWDGSLYPVSAGIALDDFSFNPVRAVPEPAGTLGSVATGLFTVRRRRQPRRAAL